MLPAGWSKLFSVLTNILIVSIPEELFLVSFTLFLLNQFDFLESKVDGQNKLKSEDIARVGFIVVFTAVTSNIFRFYLNLDPGFGFLVLVLIMFSMILLIFKLYYNIVDIFKTFIFVICSFIVLTITELLYVPVTLNIINKSINEVNSSIFLNFLLSLPERIIQFTLLGYMFIKKKSFIKTSLLKVITNNKVFMIFTCVLLVVNLSFLLGMVILVTYKNFLDGFSIFLQILIISLILLFPIVNLSIYFWSIFVKDLREREERFVLRQDLEALIKDLKRFTEYENYDKINLILDDLETDVKNVYKNYEKDVKT